MLAHLWQFELSGHTYVAPEHPEWESGESDTVLPAGSTASAGSPRVTSSSTSSTSVMPGCTSAAWRRSRIDPAELLGEVPEEPTAYDGWGILPDQYLRRFSTDDGDTPEPPDERNRDLPPFRPWWGAEAARDGTARGVGNAQGRSADLS